MCYCPLGCLKFIVGFGAFLSILISVGILGLTIYVNIDKKDIINNSSEGQINTALIILYVSSFVFMVLGICGLYGVFRNRKKKNSGTCLLGIFFIGVVIFLLAFIGGTIFFFIGPEAIFGTDCKQGSKTDLVKDLYEINLKASQTLCAQECPCYLETKNLNSSLTDILTQRGKTFYSDNPSSSKNYDECISQEESSNSNILLMGALEDLLQCGGWCPQDDKYLKFSDINNCVSESCLTDMQSCHDKFQSFMKEQGILIGIGCGVGGGICLINLIAICCMCYHPSKTQRKNQFYRRMMDED